MAWSCNSRGGPTLQDHSGRAQDPAWGHDTIGSRRKAVSGVTVLPGADTRASSSLNPHITTTTKDPGTSAHDFDGSLTCDAGANGTGSARVYARDCKNRILTVTATGPGIPSPHLPLRPLHAGNGNILRHVNAVTFDCSLFRQVLACSGADALFNLRLNTQIREPRN